MTPYGVTRANELSRSLYAPRYLFHKLFMIGFLPCLLRYLLWRMLLRNEPRPAKQKPQTCAWLCLVLITAVHGYIQYIPWNMHMIWLCSFLLRLYYQYVWTCLTHIPIFYRVTLLVLENRKISLITAGIILKNMDKIDMSHTCIHRSAQPWANHLHIPNYSDLTMREMASQITGVTSVYSTVCLGADQR